ncbi:unnamed protein product [Caenorhabditis sp. 36 PRJEB53466]|nr:unnamed protein product [Caenorhabditis sp. 36 PRJEB53466]
MPPKKQPRLETKTGGLLKFFAKEQEKRAENRQQPANFDDDSCQILFETPQNRPGPSAATTPNTLKKPQSSAPSKTPETPKNATKWAETLQKTGGSSAGRDWQNPCPIAVGSAKKNDEKNAKSLLLDHGFDNIHGNGIFYPIDEPIRNFEVNLIKCAAASNCCIALPSCAPSSSARICAITVLNFLKWFPRSRALLVTSSDTWFSALRRMGLEAQCTKLATLTQFKHLKTDPGSILICATPQCAVKVVESMEAESFLEDIRLVLMDLKPAECCAKYKPILNALTVKDTFFRSIVLTTSISNTSRRTASITKRQLMITNLQLSDWIEQSDTDFAFRSANIPAGVEVKLWKSESVQSEKLAEIVAKFEDFCRKPMERLVEERIITIKSLKKSIWTCWKSLKSATNSFEKRQKLEIAELLTTCYKILTIDGIVAARNYTKNFTEQAHLRETAEQILEIFGGFSEFPPKFQLITDAIEAFLKMDNHLRGAILCRDSDQALEIQNYLELQLPKSVIIVRIVEENGQTARNLWQISRISTVFVDRKSPKIVIIPVKIRDFIGFSDQFPTSELTFVASVSRESLFNFRKFAGAHLLILNDPIEKLRSEDGRLIVDDGKFAQKDGKHLKLGAVERYDFKFESSRLRFDPAELPVQFFYPRSLTENESISKIGKARIEMTSKEHAELHRRIKNPDISRFQRKKKSFWVLQDMADPNGKGPLEVEAMDEDQVMWNQDVQYLGDIPPSSLTKQVTKYLKSGPFEWRIGSDKRRYQYVNEITSEQRLLHLDRLLQNIDSNFVS